MRNRVLLAAVVAAMVLPAGCEMKKEPSGEQKQQMMEQMRQRQGNDPSAGRRPGPGGGTRPPMPGGMSNGPGGPPR